MPDCVLHYIEILVAEFRGQARPIPLTGERVADVANFHCVCDAWPTSADPYIRIDSSSPCEILVVLRTLDGFFLKLVELLQRFVADL